MFIQNLNLRHKLGMGRLCEADSGAGGGSETGQIIAMVMEQEKAQKEQKHLMMF